MTLRWSLSICVALAVASPDVAGARAMLVRTAERLDGSAIATASRSPEEVTARELEDVLVGPLRDTRTSMFVADADTGERLFAVEPDRRLNPASNVKLIATATALDLVGADFRYWTGVLGEAPDEAGVAHGDLYLLGTYDPTLDRDALADLASQLVRLGTTRLDGDVVVDATSSRDGVFRSFVALTIVARAPGQAPAVIASPANELIELDVRAVTAKTKRARHELTVKTSVRDDAGRRRVVITISGEIGRRRTVEKTVWITERALLAAHLLRRALADAGVVVDGDVHAAPFSDFVTHGVQRGWLPVPLAEHYSQPLASIIKRVNKRSTNWLADRIIMTTAARRYGGKPSMEAAVEAMYGWLQRRTGLRREDLVIDTGSGLSYATKISTRQIVMVLRTAAGLGDHDPVHVERRARRWDAYRDSLAIGGRDGTLRYRFRGLEAKVFGKTGTLSNVVALSGMLEVAPDRRLVFSIVTNGHAPRRKAAVRRAQERLVTALSRYLHHE